MKLVTFHVEQTAVDIVLDNGLLIMRLFSEMLALQGGIEWDSYSQSQTQNHKTLNMFSVNTSKTLQF